MVCNSQSQKRGQPGISVCEVGPERESPITIIMRGRPVNQNSARQQRLRQMVPGRERGRPVNQNSARQRRLRQMVPGSERGRPVNQNSARHKRLRQIVPGRERGRPVDPMSARQRLGQMVPGRERGRPVNPLSARQHKINKSMQALQWSDMDTHFEMSDSGEVSVIAPEITTQHPMIETGSVSKVQKSWHCHITDTDVLFKRPASVTGTPPE